MSPRTSVQNEELRQVSIKRILDASFEQFAINGYNSTSMTKIAKAAKLSKGLLYNYFDSKEELLKAVLLDAMNEMDGAMNMIVKDNPHKTLSNIIEYVFTELQENYDRWKLFMELSFKVNQLDFIHDMALDKLNAYIPYLADLLKQIGFKNSEQEARLLAATFDGIGTQYMVLRDDYPLESMKTFLIQKYCK